MSADPPPATAPSSKRTYAAVVALAAGFAVIMLVREPVQARYFAWQIRRIHHRPESYEHYFFKLACLKDAALPAVRILLADEDAEHRRIGARLLHHLSRDAARPLLLETMNDMDAEVRRTAAMGLALDDDPSVRDAFRVMLHGDDEEAAALAAGMLGRMGGAAAADALLDVLAGDPPVMLMAEAIDGLGQIRDERAVPLLTPALNDDRPLPHPTEWDRLAGAVLSAAKAQVANEVPSSQPMEMELETPTTVADVAARALRRINGATAQRPRPDLPAR